MVFVCTKCGKEKDASEFGRRANGKDCKQRNCKQCLNEYVASRTEKSLEAVILSLTKKRARETGVPFELTKEDINLPESCPVLGFPLRKNKGHCGADSFSLDRIKPELGYVRGNVQVISLLANRMKT